MDRAFGPDDWLRHNEALRRMARALLRDESRGDDVVQSAYLAALERPPLRMTAAWLRRVVRSRALDALRREGRRREAPLDGSELRAPDFARKLELHRVLVAAVQELAEPYQRVIYLRYFEGRSPTEIAGELGAPVKTVKTRLSRGLAQLRERLGREYGDGDWTRVLAVTFWPGARKALEWSNAATAAGGAGIMGKKIALATGLVLTLAGVAYWMPRGGEPTEPAAAAVVEPEPAPVVAPPDAELSSAVDVASARAPAQPKGAVEAPLAEVAPPTATLVVRAFWPDGGAASGVGIHLRRAGGSGLPYHGIARVVTDASGVARFEDVPPGTGEVNADRRAYDNTLEVEVAPGEETTVRFELAAGVAVEGIVRDRSGAAVPGASVWLTTGHADWMGGQTIATTDAGGRFHLRDVPREQSLGAFAAGFGPSALVDLEALDAESQPLRVELELTAEGGSLRGIVTGPDGEPIAGATVSAGAYAESSWGMTSGALRTERWTPRTATTDGRGAYAMHGLPPGELPLRVRAPGLPIWKDEVEIRAGATARVDVALVASVTVEGTVRDVEGEPVEGAVVRAFDADVPRHFLQFGQYDHDEVFGYPATTTDGDGRYRLDAIPAGDVHLYANPHRDPRGYHTGGLMRAERVLRAEPGDRLFWDPVLSEGRVIEGTVTYRDGHPMPWHFVSARNDETGVAQSIKTDENGGFRFVNMDDAPHVLGVQLWDPPEDARPVEARDVWPDRGRVELVASFDKPVELALGTVRGVIDDAGERAENPDLLAPVLESDKNFFRVYVERDGPSFVFPDVKPGRYKPVVLVGDNPVFAGEWFELAPGANVDLGVLETEPGGSVLIRVARDKLTESAEPRMFLRQDGVMNSRSVEVGSAAEVLVDNLNAGTYTVGAHGDGMLMVYTEVTVKAGEQAELVLELTPAVRRRIEITWPENEALGGLSATVVDAYGEEPYVFSETNVSFLTRPYFREPQLPVGSYTVTAESESGLRGTARFEVLDLKPDQPVVTVRMR